MHELYETQKRKLVTNLLINESFPAHLHQSIELLYMVEGSCTIEIDNTAYRFNAGDFAITFPYHIHKIIMNPEKHAVLQYIICPIKDCGEYTSMFLSHIPEAPIIKSPQLPLEVSNAFKMIQTYQLTQDTLVRAYTHLIFAYCTTLFHFNKNQYHDVENNIEKLTNYI